MSVCLEEAHKRLMGPTAVNSTTIVDVQRMLIYVERGERTCAVCGRS